MQQQQVLAGLRVFQADPAWEARGLVGADAARAVRVQLRIVEIEQRCERCGGQADADEAGHMRSKRRSGA
ncbi:hypothetical protein [Xanthomonas bonasiae]|uniref:hypothetical protein n=1 Tax=Xanthomonas bonasiae TaxID=2810351 RepID=UPI0030B91A82